MSSPPNDIWFGVTDLILKSTLKLNYPKNPISITYTIPIYGPATRESGTTN